MAGGRFRDARLASGTEGMESLSQASLADPYAEGTKLGLERKLFEVRETI